MSAMATTDHCPTRRFTMACGVLSRYVKAASTVAAPARMGSEGVVDGAQQLTIFYGGRVVVVDGCTAAMASEVIRFAASASPAPTEPTMVDMPIARKASLQRFLAKRKDRASVEARPPPATTKKGKTEASSWLTLGSLADMHAAE